jgi:heme-degrading monooxygenase HmoA
MFVILWSFEVKGGNETAFEKTYGPDGAWAEFFRRDPAFRGTRLARDTAQPLRYYTLDFWTSRGAYETFVETHGKEYAALDAKCEPLTAREIHLGSCVCAVADASAI